MRPILFVALLAVQSLFAGATAAQSVRNAEVENTIRNQIEAFRSDDFETAFTFASPMIKQLFGSVQNFETMVKRGYPMVHRPSDFRFLGQSEEGVTVQQILRVRDAQGRVHLLEYRMIKTENGWRINGVSLLKGEGLAA